MLEVVQKKSRQFHLAIVKKIRRKIKKIKKENTTEKKKKKKKERMKEILQRNSN
jgi:hypothetical protein